MNRNQVLLLPALVLVLLACKKSADKAAPAGSTAAAAPAAPKVEPWCGASPCPCTPGTERKNGDKLSGCTLAAPATIQGLSVEKNISFNDTGFLAQFYLAEDGKIGPVTCKKGGLAEAFGPGQLHSCYTVGTATIDGVACTGSVSMTKDGKLRRCKLAADKTIGDLAMKAGDWLTLYPGGTPERFESSRVIEIQGRKCKGYLNYLHENGKLKKCAVAEDTTIGGKAYKAGTSVCFDPNGKVVDCSTLSFSML